MSRCNVSWSNRERLLGVVELIIFGDASPKLANVASKRRAIAIPIHPREFHSTQFRRRDAQECRFYRVCEDNSCTPVEILRRFIWEAETQPLRKSFDRSDATTGIALSSVINRTTVVRKLKYLYSRGYTAGACNKMSVSYNPCTISGRLGTRSSEVATEHEG